MQIHLNGELHECPDAMTLAALVATLDLAGKRLTHQHTNKRRSGHDEGHAD